LPKLTPISRSALAANAGRAHDWVLLLSNEIIFADGFGG
jgi:hypothetical protein